MLNNCTRGFIKPGKINIIIDGQFGSTGKGLIAAKIASDNLIHVAVGTLSPNAGHTFYIDEDKYTTHLIPVAGVIHPESTIYLSAECVIDELLLLQEIEEFGISHDRIIIHPRAAIITEEHKKKRTSTCSNS